MVKCFKKAGLSKLSPAFFIMINSLSVALMLYGKEQISKIKKFVSYWIEKIEIEVVEENDYEYPKFVLRNTLCHFHNELGEITETKNLSSLAAKEIISSVNSPN